MRLIPNLQSATTNLKSATTNATGFFLRILSEENAQAFYNSQLWNEHAGVTAHLKELEASLEDNEPSDAQKTQLIDLSASKRALSTRILQASSQDTILADADSFLLEQMVANERVHKLVDEGQPVTDDHIKEFRDYRLGELGANKSAQAFILNRREGPTLHTQIFCLDVAVDEINGQIYRGACPGNPDEIKTTQATALTGAENVRAYWTISANEDINGAGSKLIDGLGAVLPEGYAEITVSPMRDFTKAHGRDVLLAMDMEELTLAWNKHLLDGFVVKDRKTGVETVKVDSVMGFHVLGKGGNLGGRHRNPDSILDPFVMNYVYDRAQAQTYKKMARDGVIPMSSDFYQSLANPDQTARAYCVSDRRFMSIVDAPRLP